MNSPRIRVILVGTMGSLAGMLSRALVNVPQGADIVKVNEGDTIVFEPGDIVLCESQKIRASLEQLKVLDPAILDIACEPPPMCGGCHEGTAFYESLPRLRRRNNRRRPR
ncbi:MAG: hypothetical protein KBC33_00160 [Candidatus Pacebacteria bacterium]|nr:hypothetical protein [Candidatus Paceibacterota bacterium]